MPVFTSMLNSNSHLLVLLGLALFPVACSAPASPSAAAPVDGDAVAPLSVGAPDAMAPDAAVSAIDAGAALSLATTIEIAVWGDSWSKGQPPTGTSDAEFFALNALLEKSITEEGLHVTLKWVGYVDQGQAPTNHRSGVGGTTVADHINGNGTRGSKAFADYWGPSKPAGCPGIFMGIIAHNDSVPSYTSTAPKSGVVNAYLTLHGLCSVSRFVFVTADGSSSITFQQMRAYATKTAIPQLVAAGLSIEAAPCVLDDPAKLAPDGHPNPQGYIDMAGQHVDAVMRQIRAVAEAQ